MPIKKAIDELARKNDITDFKIFKNAVREKTETVINDKRLTNEIIKAFSKEQEIIRSAWNHDELIYRAQIAEKAKINIKINEEERKERKLYIGHRLIPFLKPKLFNSKNIIFTNKNDNLIPIKTDVKSTDNAMEYFLFFDASVIDPYFEDNQNFKLNYLDISQFQQNILNFQVTVLDYQKNKFQIEPLTKEYFIQNHFLIEKRNSDLLAGVNKIVNKISEFISVDNTLLSAYYHFGQKIISNPGSPFAQIFNKQNKLSLQMGLDYTYFFSKQKIIEHISAEIEFGKAKKMNGILRELGLSFSPDFLYLLMLEQYHEESEIDDDFILNVLMEAPYRIHNKLQKKNLEKAYEKLRNKVIKESDFFQFDTFTLNYINLLLHLETNIIGLLRKFDENPTIENDTKMEMIIPFFEADKLINFMIENFVKVKMVEPQELKDLQALYSDLSPTIDSVLEFLDSNK